MIRTLVVDDDFMAVSVHRQFIERIDGFKVVGAATTGKEALSLVEQLHPDLVLLDIFLPDENGIELMRRLRAGDSQRVDVIAITEPGLIVSQNFCAGVDGADGLVKRLSHVRTGGAAARQNEHSSKHNDDAGGHGSHITPG